MADRLGTPGAVGFLIIVFSFYFYYLALISLKPVMNHKPEIPASLLMFQHPGPDLEDKNCQALRP
jgi:hypothetical protein